MKILAVISVLAWFLYTDIHVKLITGRSTIWWAKHGKMQGSEEWGSKK